MVKVIDLTTKDMKNHEKNIGRGYTQINVEVKGERRKGKRRVSHKVTKDTKEN